MFWCWRTAPYDAIPRLCLFVPGDESIVYTGDFNTTPDRHLGAAAIDCLEPNIMISESTYATTIRDSKRVREREFLQQVAQSPVAVTEPWATARGRDCLNPRLLGAPAFAARASATSGTAQAAPPVAGGARWGDVGKGRGSARRLSGPSRLHTPAYPQGVGTQAPAGAPVQYYTTGGII